MAFFDIFSSLDDLNGRDRRDPKKLLAALAVVKRFSCFEVDNAMARPMTWLLNESGWVVTKNQERVRDADGCGWHEIDLFPWTYVDLTPAGFAALAAPEAST